MSEVSPLRRQPVQQRSARRVAAMLDACADLLDEVGYEGLTTTAIAQRAGVAVGSVYQFFGDKKAVVRALTERNLEEFFAEVERSLDASESRNWPRVVDTLLDVYLRMHRELPGFARVHFGDAVDPHLLDTERDNNAVVADALTRLLQTLLGMPAARIALPVSVAVEAADALLKLAFRRAPHGDEAVLAEARSLVHRYLESRLGS